MPSLLLHTFTSVCVLSAHMAAAVAAVMVGVAGRTVTLPCRLEAANQRGVEVCWGRGQPSLFTCHNAVINSAGDQVSYRRSDRYSVSSSSSLNIINAQSSDAGFYHCRVLLPGLFNDQTSSVHLIIIQPRSAVSSSGESSELSDNQDAENPDARQTTAGYSTRDATQDRGHDAGVTGPVVAHVQSPVQQQQQVNSLLVFVGNTVRLSLAVFVPALLLTAAHRRWRTKQNSDEKLDQSEEENSSV